MSEPRQQDLDQIASMMLDAGCEVVVALSAEPGVGVIAIADDIDLSSVVDTLRNVADAIEADRVRLIGLAKVEQEINENEELTISEAQRRAREAGGVLEMTIEPIGEKE